MGAIERMGDAGSDYLQDVSRHGVVSYYFASMSRR